MSAQRASGRWMSAFGWRTPFPRLSSLSLGPEPSHPPLTTLHAPVLPPIPSLPMLSADMADIRFTYALPARCLLQTIPCEIADIIFTDTLTTHPGSHLPLLLTSKHVNNVVTASSNDLACRQARHRSALAAVLFSPRPGENLLGSWFPRLSQSVKAIGDIHLDSTRLWALHQLTLTEMMAAMSVLKIGLYLVESLHFGGPHKAASVRHAPRALPTHGILLIRLTSMVLTLMLAHEARDGFWYVDTYAPRGPRERAPRLNGADHVDIFTLAVENQLLRYGVGWVAGALETLEVAARPAGPAGPRYLQWQALVRKRALRRVKEGMKWVCWCRHYEGILRVKRRDQVVSERLRQAYGDLHMKIVAGARWEGVRVMMRWAEEGIADRGE